MKPSETITDLTSHTLRSEENELSRRYLKLLCKWIPIATSSFERWPMRDEAGHFFGGVFPYGQETNLPALAVAAASSSPEFDEDLAGTSREELQKMVRMAIRYLCYTHDTGPEECIRPSTSWGRTLPCSTKWGERGRGFFFESQCGVAVFTLIQNAVLVSHLLGDEEIEMIGAIAADYIERFGRMAPKSGTYRNTQMEENAWTALGLTASALFLEKDHRCAGRLRHARRWMICATAKPADAYDQTPMSDGATVKELVGEIFTTLPDNTAENHGMVHPDYMGSSIELLGNAKLLLSQWSRDIPPEASHHHAEIYEQLLRWCDKNGLPLAPQGMDWPYYPVTRWIAKHTLANLHLGDSGAALIERRLLDVMERVSALCDGDLIPPDTKKYCHGQQDPAVMQERVIGRMAVAYLAHRINGMGTEPCSEDELYARQNGVHLYSHGGSVVHVTQKGRSSLSWRNSSMALSSPPEGVMLIGNTSGSVLAQPEIRNHPASRQTVILTVREQGDRVAVYFVEDLSGRSVRRYVHYASLPDGRSIVRERLIAREPLIVDSLRQGYVAVINDPIFVDPPKGPSARSRSPAGSHMYAGSTPHQSETLKSIRAIVWSTAEGEGRETFEGFAAPTEEYDRRLDLGRAAGGQPVGADGAPADGAGATRSTTFGGNERPAWISIEDRFGIVFIGNGRTTYLNRHTWKKWRAVEDDLCLNSLELPIEADAGSTICELTSLWCPGLNESQTSGETLSLNDQRPSPVDGSGTIYLHRVDISGWSLLVNESDEWRNIALPELGGDSGGHEKSGSAPHSIDVAIAPHEPRLIKR